MRILISINLFSLILFVACSHSENHSKGTELLKASPKERISTETFEKALSREVYLAGGNYHIIAFPYTQNYIHSLVEEKVEKKSLKPKEKKETLERLKDRYSEEKTCFKFRYSVLRFNEVGQLKDWQVTFVNEEGEKASLNWESNPKRDPSFAESDDPLAFHHDKWLGDGVACSTQKLDLNKSFRLKVKPQYVQFPFDSHGDLNWQFK